MTRVCRVEDAFSPPLDAVTEPHDGEPGSGGRAVPQEPLFDVAVPAARFGTAVARWKRMTPSVLLNRLKRPMSDRRHARADAQLAALYDRSTPTRRPALDDVVILGAFGKCNGLSRAARYELDRLRRRFPNAPVIDLDRNSSLAAFAARRANRSPGVAIFLVQPNLLAKYMRGIDPALFREAYRIGLAVWELPYFPPGWRAVEPFFDEYWTPSAFSAAALALGTDRPVLVVPHVIPPDGATWLRPEPREADGVGFRGLALMDLSTCPDRKNPWAHIEAWQKAFADSPDAVLTMKLRFSRRTAGIRGELLAMIGRARNIEIVEQDLSDHEVGQLQRRSDVCLSLHRAEGFGLTIYEMLELGRSAIATNWSGNVEFMQNYPRAHPVSYKLVPYRDYLRRYPGYVGEWAEADTSEAACLLRIVAREHRERRPSARQAASAMI